MIAATVSVEGLSYVNLDSLLEDRMLFCALVVLPASIGIIGLVVAMLPRIVTVNLAVFVLLLLVAEGGAWVLTARRPVIQGEPEAIGAPTFYLPDTALGYVMAPSAVARHRRTVDDTVIYDVTYRTDAAGRRDTPASPGIGRRSFLIFFGDSNTFGEGLSQVETLPYYAGELAPASRPYNYGVPGYGPSQALTLAELGRLPREIPERDGYAVFFLIPAHLGRVVGSSPVSTGWGRHFPYYQVRDQGELVAHGDFAHGRPFTTLAYFLWTKSSLAASLGVDLPLRYTTSHHRLTAKILGESRRRLAQQVHFRDFVVILGQVYNDAQRGVMQDLRDALTREGLTHLDYTRLLDARDPRSRLSEFDYHNSAAANRLIAARLVADLGLLR